VASRAGKAHGPHHHDDTGTTTPRQDTTAVPKELLKIRGIGPNVAQRLADLGVDTPQTLAAATADEIVALATGWPFRPDRERVQEWINQAHGLLDAAPPAVDPKTQQDTAHAPADVSPRVRHTFTVQVQTDQADNGEVLATKVIDVQSQAFDTWSGWDPERLVRFVVHHSGLRDRSATDQAPPDRPHPPDPAKAPQPRSRAVRGFGVLNAGTTVPGGRSVRVILRLGPADTGADIDASTVEWELVCGPAHGTPQQRLARRQLDLVAGEPMVATIDVTIPEAFGQARLASVVRILGDGDQPPIAHVLTDTKLDVSPLP
jgi:predicted flap endonuclease-1-like 5' DNA nuclease